MTHDFTLEKDISFGEWLHGQLTEAAFFEQDPWWLDRARRVEDRLQIGRPEAGRLRPWTA